MNTDASPHDALPDDVATLQRELLRTRQELSHTEHVLAETAVTCDHQQVELAKLQEELELLKRYLFGRRSERPAPDPRQGTLSFGETPDEVAPLPVLADEEIAYRRRLSRGAALISGWWRTWWPARLPITFRCIASKISWPAAAWN